VPPPRLTETSFVVLGLLEHFQPATPYELKALAQVSIFDFWAIPHTRLYSECARLAEAGLLDEQREQSGRRRHTYRLTAAGRRELERWRAQPTAAEYALRDVATLKLFFGADPQMLAGPQIEVHRRRLRNYEQLRSRLAEDAPRGWLLALEAGIGHEREFLRFWSRLA